MKFPTNNKVFSESVFLFDQNLWKISFELQIHKAFHFIFSNFLLEWFNSTQFFYENLWKAGKLGYKNINCIEKLTGIAPI